MSRYVKVSWALADEEWWYNDKALARWLRARIEEERAKDLRRRPYLPVEAWHRILARFSNRCAYCGAIGRLERDHHVPFSRGGVTDETNIVPACRPCNAAKSNADPALWPIRELA